MDIERVVLEKVVEGIDFSNYEKEINKGLKAYFGSEAFMDNFMDGLYDEAVGYELGQQVSKKMIPLIKKNLKVTLD